MTRDADFKQLVRDRMAATGQNYTAARADLVAEHDARLERARAEQRKVVGRFFRDGRLTQVPMKRKARAAVLLHLVTLFEPGRDYTEREVSEMLAQVHEDFAFWRRELVDYGYLTREAGTYRLTDRVPQRMAFMAQEIPDWEALWLPGFLAGTDSTVR